MFGSVLFIAIPLAVIIYFAWAILSSREKSTPQLPHNDSLTYFKVWNQPAEAGEVEVGRLVADEIRGNSDLGHHDQLVIRAKPGEASVYHIGRHLESGDQGIKFDRMLDDISHNHASIWTDGRSVAIRDLDSKTKTFVNGDEITDQTVLWNGDIVGIGQEAVFHFVGPDRDKPSAEEAEADKQPADILAPEKLEPQSSDVLPEPTPPIRLLEPSELNAIGGIGTGQPISKNALESPMANCYPAEEIRRRHRANQRPKPRARKPNPSV